MTNKFNFMFLTNSWKICVIDIDSTGGNTYVSENSYTVTNSSGIVVANATYDAAVFVHHGW